MDQIAESLELDLILTNVPGKPLLWKRFLTELTRLLNCDSSFLLISDLSERGNTIFFSSAFISEEYQQQYENKLNKLDAFNYFVCKKPLTVFCNHSTDSDEINTGDADFTAPEGQCYRFGVSIHCHQNYSLCLFVNRLQAFDEREKRQAERVIQTLLPSLEEAFFEEQRYKIESQLIYYFDNHFDSYVIIDKDLTVLFTDPVYSYMITQLDCVEINENRFIIKKTAVKQRLLSLIKRGNKVASIHSQCQNCQITLIPIAILKNLYHWECYKNGFIITFTHNKNNNRSLARLTEIYQLSHCEAACALDFMRTPSIQEVATNTFRSQETIRNHIKRTMQKMDVHNQAELMKKLLTLASL